MAAGTSGQTRHRGLAGRPTRENALSANERRVHRLRVVVDAAGVRDRAGGASARGKISETAPRCVARVIPPIVFDNSANELLAVVDDGRALGLDKGREVQ